MWVWTVWPAKFICFPSLHLSQAFPSHPSSRRIPEVLPQHTHTHTHTHTHARTHVHTRSENLASLTIDSQLLSDITILIAASAVSRDCVDSCVYVCVYVCV
jgi:hypothetical protein